MKRVGRWTWMLLTLLLLLCTTAFAADEKTYIEFLKNHRQAVFELFLKNQDIAQFEKILDILADEDCLRQWIDAAGQIHRYEFVSLLMDYQQQHYGKKQKTFDL